MATLDVIQKSQIALVMARPRKTAIGITRIKIPGEH